jgi:hypothetical protein
MNNQVNEIIRTMATFKKATNRSNLRFAVRYVRIRS